MLELCLSTIKEGFDPIIAFPEEGPFQAGLQQAGIETMTYPLGIYRPGAKSLCEVVSFAGRMSYCLPALAYLILRRNIRAVYINGLRCLPVGVAAARLTGRPVIFHLHNTVTRRAEVILAGRSARHATRVIACSRGAIESLWTSVPALQRNSIVIHNCAWESPTWTREPTTPHEGPIVFGIVGRISEVKGHHLLLEAAARLEPSLRERIRLKVVGAPGPSCVQDEIYLQSLQEQSLRLGLHGQVAWEGHQSDPNVFYCGMDVLVIAATGNEGLPLVAVEALQRGIPVVASAVGGNPEVVQPDVNGWVVPPSDIPALTAVLGRIVAQPDSCLQLGRAAKADAQRRFSRETFTQAFQKVLDEAFGAV